jgi:hypothetical protein
MKNDSQNNVWVVVGLVEQIPTSIFLEWFASPIVENRLLIFRRKGPRDMKYD